MPSAKQLAKLKEREDRAKITLQEKLSSGVDPTLIFLNRAEAAHYLGVSFRTMESKSTTEFSDLPFSLVGKKAMYQLSALRDFLLARTKGAA